MSGNSSLEALEPACERAALDESRRWLSLVDDGRHTESWAQAGEKVRRAVTAEQWGEQLQMVRSPLGNVIERTLSVKSFALPPPGAGVDIEASLHYSTRFELGAAIHRETVVLLPVGNEWKVSAYFIS